MIPSMPLRTAALIATISATHATMAFAQPTSVDERYASPSLAADLDGDGIPELAATAPGTLPTDQPRFLILSGATHQVLLDLEGVAGEQLRPWVHESADKDAGGTPGITVYTDFVDSKGALRRRSHEYSRTDGTSIRRQDRLTATWHWWAADFDGNNIVEQDDLDAFSLLWLAGQTQVVSPEALDVNRDGAVDAADLTFMIEQIEDPPSVGNINRRPAPAPPASIRDRDIGDSGVDDGGLIGPDPDGTIGGTGHAGSGGGGDCPSLSVPPASTICLSTDKPCDILTFTASGTGPFEWAAYGAEALSDPHDGTFTIQICQAGEVVIRLSGPPDRCPQAMFYHFKAFRVDIDAYPTDIANPQDLTFERDAIEAIPNDDEHPGLVISCTTQDRDGDLIPDFADGMNLQQQLPSDDTGAGSAHPIRISVAPPVPSDALIRLSYSASDPSKVVLGADGWEPGPGSIRLWKSSGGQRDPRSILQGGDFIPPGIYPASLFPLRADGKWDGADLYVEAINPSRQTGDIAVTLTIDPDGPTTNGQNTLPFLCPDQIRLTAVDIKIHQFDPTTNEWLDTTGFVGTTFPNHEDRDLLDPDWTPGAWCQYVVEVIDPRDLTYKPLSIADQEQAICGPAPFHSTQPFFCTKFDPQADWVPLPFCVYLPNASGVGVQYNPYYPAKSGPKVVPPAPGQKELAPIVKKVVDEMKSEGWVPDNPADAGAFGKEVHRRVSARVRNKSRWVADIWVEGGPNGSGKILAIGDPPDVILRDTVQIDLVYLDEGYRPKIGDIYDPTRAELFDIKASARVQMDVKQIERLRPFARNERVYLCTTEHLWSESAGWHPNRYWIKKKTLFKLVGATAAVAIAFSIYEQIELLDGLDPILHRIQITPDYTERVLLVQDAVTLVVDYLRPQFELSNFGFAATYPVIINAFAGLE